MQRFYRHSPRMFGARNVHLQARPGGRTLPSRSREPNRTKTRSQALARDDPRNRRRPRHARARPFMDAAAITSEPPIAVDEAKLEPIAGAPNLNAILSIPVTVQVVLGSTSLPVSGLMKLARGAIASPA